MDQTKLTCPAAPKRKPFMLRRCAKPWIYNSDRSKGKVTLAAMLTAGDQPQTLLDSHVVSTASATNAGVSMTSTPSRATKARLAFRPPVSPICDGVQRISLRQAASPVKPPQSRLEPKMLSFFPTMGGDEDDDELVRSVSDMSYINNQADHSEMDILSESQMCTQMEVCEESLVPVDASMAEISHMDFD